VERLNRELAALLATPETREFFEKQGASAGGGTPQELADFVRSETAKWAAAVRLAAGALDAPE
jgi:tripartite-type tricarboxylate transporter receptor subunit TctC